MAPEAWSAAATRLAPALLPLRRHCCLCAGTAAAAPPVCGTPRSHFHRPLSFAVCALQPGNRGYNIHWEVKWLACWTCRGDNQCRLDHRHRLQRIEDGCRTAPTRTGVSKTRGPALSLLGYAKRGRLTSAQVTHIISRAKLQPQLERQQGSSRSSTCHAGTATCGPAGSPTFAGMQLQHVLLIPAAQQQKLNYYNMESALPLLIAQRTSIGVRAAWVGPWVMVMPLHVTRFAKEHGAPYYSTPAVPERILRTAALCSYSCRCRPQPHVCQHLSQARVPRQPMKAPAPPLFTRHPPTMARL